MDFLGLNDRTVVVMGVANRRSVAYAVSRTLTEAGARVVHVVRDADIADRNRKLFGDTPVLVCDVRDDKAIQDLAQHLGALGRPIDGLVHSIAYADYSRGFRPFHETVRRDFLEAVDISCYSMIAVANAVRPLLSADGSLVTVSISTTRMASENYGYMGPVKAALDSTVAFLAKSLASAGCPDVRVNAVGAGLLKTSASAGIPGYVDAYLYAEKVIPRRTALTTDEVAHVIAFLLSPRASGINAQTLTVDAGMSVNYFDRGIVRRVVGGQNG